VERKLAKVLISIIHKGASLAISFHEVLPLFLYIVNIFNKLGWPVNEWHARRLTFRYLKQYSSVKSVEKNIKHY